MALKYPASKYEEEFVKFVYSNGLSLLGDYAGQASGFGLWVKVPIKVASKLSEPHVLGLYNEARSLSIEQAIEFAEALDEAIDNNLDIMLCTATTAVQIPGYLLGDFLQEFADICGIEHR